MKGKFQKFEVVEKGIIPAKILESRIKGYIDFFGENPSKAKKADIVFILNEIMKPL